ncbi:MAG: hypothetical protein ACP5N1_02705 [Candidatus Woesearchaeota archaeon]
MDKYQSNAIIKYRGLVEISVVVTPWKSEYLVVEHTNPEPEQKTDSKFHNEICNYLNHGKTILSLGKSNIPIMETFPKWLKSQPDLEIRAGQTDPMFGWHTEGGLVKELFSDEYLTKRGLEIQQLHKSLQNNPKIIIKVDSIEEYKKDVEFYLSEIAFDQVIIDSAPKPAQILESGSPHEMFFDEKGLILSYAGEYDYSTGPVKLFKITNIDTTLKQSKGMFPHYSIFTETYVNGYAKYLSPGETIYRDLNTLREEKRLFDIKGRLMIIQPEACELPLWEFTKR